MTLIDSKDFFEFAPGVLRAALDPAHFPKITFPYREIVEMGQGVEFIQGEASKVDAQADGGCLMVRSSVRKKTQHDLVHFDYCVIAVGSSNGLWKPRTRHEDSAIPWAVSGMQELVPERTVRERQRTLRGMRDRMLNARRVVIVGAGLVGVELAGEICHFVPTARIRLIDGASSVLPQMPDSARRYAHTWLADHGVKVQLNSSFDPDRVREGDLVFWCGGATPRTKRLFLDESLLSSRGFVRVDRKARVMARDGQALGGGRVFAVGDAAEVEGVRLAHTISHSEEMAATAVANIEDKEGFSPPYASGGRRVEKPPSITCASLGPVDGCSLWEDQVVATGPLAALQKSLAEQSKILALKGEPTCSLAWGAMH